ncbi:hypothetical protein Efla_007027 [Eimeria flavescens]
MLHSQSRSAHSSSIDHKQEAVYVTWLGTVGTTMTHNLNKPPTMLRGMMSLLHTEERDVTEMYTHAAACFHVKQMTIGMPCANLWQLTFVSALPVGKPSGKRDSICGPVVLLVVHPVHKIWGGKFLSARMLAKTASTPRGACELRISQ